MTGLDTAKPCAGANGRPPMRAGRSPAWARRIARIVAAAWLLMAVAPAMAVAASVPAPGDLFVNDLADVLTPADEDRLRDELAALKDETGVEMTVLTIRARDDFGDAPSIEALAGRVFDAWGVGDAERNDGILVLVAAEDREMRLQLGAAYDQDYDVLAQDIIDRYFLPDFRDGDLARGIVAGTGETIARIARRHVAGLPAAALPARPGRFPPWLPFVVIVAFGGAMVFRRRIADWSYRWRRCPTCGRRGLHRGREVFAEGTEGVAGRGVVRTACRNCDFREEHTFRPARAGRAGKGGGFGGGRSSGGGATGSW